MCRRGLRQLGLAVGSGTEIGFQLVRTDGPTRRLNIGLQQPLREFTEGDCFSYADVRDLKHSEIRLLSDSSNIYIFYFLCFIYPVF
jgi:hypothetical protein